MNFKVFSEEKCRNCGFILESHELTWHDGKNVPVAKAFKFGNEININLFCKEFVPNDNLEYLEWKFSKKNG